jgi:ribosome-binding factor A
MREFQRTERLGTELQRELAELLRDKVKDPRLGMVTVQEVRVSRDLSHAKVYFTCMGDDPKGTEKLLNRKLAGFLRHELAHRIHTRTMAQLHFVYDESIERGEHLADLIERAVAQEAPDEDGP